MGRVRLLPGEVPPGRTRVLLALVELYERDGRATVHGVADRAGITRAPCHGHLCRLRRQGLVDWEPGHAGTLRPLLRVVAHG